MGASVQPTPPNIELELAKAANDAIAAHNDPQVVTSRLHDMIGYLRANPSVAQNANDALAHGMHVDDLSEQMAPHVQMWAKAQRGMAQDSTDANSGVFAPNGLAAKVVGNAENIAQGIPGMEAVEAGVGSLASHLPGMGKPISYRQSLQTLRGLTSQIPKSVSFGEHVLGGAGLAGLPGVSALSPAAFGAAAGGADQLLSANPDEGIGQRLFNTGVGAAGGALFGKAIGTAATGLRSFFSGNTASKYLTMAAERAQSAKALYDRAIAEGRVNEATPIVRSFLQEPEVKPIVDGLLGTEAFRGKDPASPEVLDAVYKTLSDQAKSAAKGLEAADPGRPNLGRFRIQNAKALQQKLLAALSSGDVKPPMTLDIPAATHTVEPEITPGREWMQGPIGEGTAGANKLGLKAVNPNGSVESVAGRDIQGPAGPAFQLPAVAGKVRPGVEINTPAMRVQTAPAEPMPAMMPSYQKAVEDYARRSANIKAMLRANDAVLQGASGRAPSSTAILKGKTGEGLTDFLRDPATSDAERQAAEQGILGAVKASQHGLLGPLSKSGRSAANAAIPLLKAANPEQAQTLLQLLLGANSATQAALQPGSVPQP